jgi:hypothetical protein
VNAGNVKIEKKFKQKLRKKCLILRKKIVKKNSVRNVSSE